MKVILRKSINDLGREGEVVEVKRGYARNFLLPQNLAQAVSAGALGELNKRKVKLEQKRDKELENIKAIADLINGKEVVVAMDTGGEGKLYGAVHAAHIAAGLKGSLGVDVDKHKVDLVDPIKQIGEYEVTIRLLKDIRPKVRVKVVPKV